jgi:hypothetical protein
VTAKADPPLRPAPAELAALAAATHPNLDEEPVRLLIAGATTAGIPWPRILRAITWDLANPEATMHDLRTAVYAGAPGKAPTT